MTLKQLENHVKRLEARAAKQLKNAEGTLGLLKAAQERLKRSRAAGKVVPEGS